MRNKDSLKWVIGGSFTSLLLVAATVAGISFTAASVDSALGLDGALGFGEVENAGLGTVMFGLICTGIAGAMGASYASIVAHESGVSKTLNT